MDSPVRQYQKQKDYQRHKLFRKLKRRRAAERQQEIDAPIREMKRRVRLKRYNRGKDSGIHIKPENRGKFTALKKRTGKTTEQLTHSKNPLTRKRAIFAQNSRKWHHK